VNGGLGIASQSGYLPVSEHGMIGDLQTIALVGTNGTIDWHCCPSFDAPSVFGSILDADGGGCFELAADLPAKTRQFYLPDTNVLITRFFAEDGVGEIQDFMPIADAAEPDRHRLIRRVACVRGVMPFRALIAPRFGYGMETHKLNEVEHGVVFAAPGWSIGLATTMPVTHENDPDASKDVYGGHPWAGNGTVTYHAHGNGMSVVEVALDPSAIAPGETTSYVYFKGDQKDVFKPQAVVSVKWILFETPM